MCWVGLPFVVLGPSVLDERVGTGPIVTYLDSACAQATPRLSKNLGHMPMIGRVVIGELWQTDVIKITKEIRLLFRQNMSCPKPQRVQSVKRMSQSTCRFFIFDNPIHKNHIKYQH